MNFDLLLAGLGKELADELEDFAQRDKTAYRERDRKRAAWDLGLLLACCIALVVVLLQFLPGHPLWGAADWVLQLSLLAMLAVSVLLQLVMIGLDRGSCKDDALRRLCSQAERSCGAFRRRLRDGSRPEERPDWDNSARKKEIEQLVRLCRDACAPVASGEAISFLKAWRWRALALLSAIYAAFIIPYFTADLHWDSVN